MAAEYLLRRSEPFIVVDECECCLAAKYLPLKKISSDEVDSIEPSKNYFLKGSVKFALNLIEKLKPKLVFPTAPIHVAASLVAEKYGMVEWEDAIKSLLLRIPSSVIVSAGRASIVTSYNKDVICQPACVAPGVCPITGMKKPYPMHELLRVAAPDGIILRSYQLEPDLGALDGGELLDALKTCGRSNKVIIGTACECHGVITALKKPAL